MDPSVLAAIAKWPDVPHVFGWLLLTARGEWRLRGEPIANPAICEFIGRNYAADDCGRWYFQNGPQRVYVTLELAPWVYRVQPDGQLRTFTGLAPTQLSAAALVEGSIFALVTEFGAGAVDDRDTDQFLRALSDHSGRPLDDAALERAIGGGLSLFVTPTRCGLEGSTAQLQRLSRNELGAAFGFQREPVPD